MTLATRSLPVPLSPVSSTVDAGLTAILATRCRSAVIGGEAPTTPLQAVRPGSIGSELPHFAPQPRRFQRALDGRGDLVQVERLVGEVVRPELHRLDGSLDAGVRRQENDEDVLVELLRLAQDGDAVGIGKPIVEKNQVDAFRKFVQGGASRFGFEHVVSFGLEALGKRPTDKGFVVDDQNRGFGHDGIRKTNVSKARVQQWCRLESIISGQILRHCRRKVGNFSRWREDSPLRRDELKK